MSESDFRTEKTVPARDAGDIDEEAMEAAEGLTPSPGTAEHYREMTERGAHREGEGRIP